MLRDSGRHLVLGGGGHRNSTPTPPPSSWRNAELKDPKRRFAGFDLRGQETVRAYVFADCAELVCNAGSASSNASERRCFVLE
jgi:hypothetical protein